MMRLILALLSVYLFTASCKKEENDSNLVKDIDGNIYHIINLGNQVWMIENLRTTKYNDGTEIVLASEPEEWETHSSGAYCWYPYFQDSDRIIYGALYNQDAVKTGKLAPTGWHVSTLQDWIVLTEHLGGESEAGGLLKESGYAHWGNPNTGATNMTGFTAVAGGSRVKRNEYDQTGFRNMKYEGIWWAPSESEGAPDYMYTFEMNCYSKGVNISGTLASNYNGFSVRCVKDR
jgi:uncharacterized protein (TIGR02145 family)